MPHRLARLKQDVSGFLNLHDKEQILERITSQDWSDFEAHIRQRQRRHGHQFLQVGFSGV